MNRTSARLVTAPAALLVALMLGSPAEADKMHPDGDTVIRQLLEANADAYRLDHEKAEALMEGIDWSGVDRLTVELDDNLFEPETIKLKLHKPYRITLDNIGFESHDIAGEEIFSSLLVKKVRSKNLEVDAYHLERLVIRPKESVELWVVPVRTAYMHFVCTLPGHYEEGMAGHLEITD